MVSVQRGSRAALSSQSPRPTQPSALSPHPSPHQAGPEEVAGAGAPLPLPGQDTEERVLEGPVKPHDAAVEGELGLLRGHQEGHGSDSAQGLGALYGPPGVYLVPQPEPYLIPPSWGGISPPATELPTILSLVPDCLPEPCRGA